MIGTMNPLSWCFAVLIDLLAQQRCPSEKNRGGHHEPLMVAMMNGPGGRKRRNRTAANRMFPQVNRYVVEANGTGRNRVVPEF
jgi:hypothetical protein